VYKRDDCPPSKAYEKAQRQQRPRSLSYSLFPDAIGTMPGGQPRAFVPEGGKFYLAEALFADHKYKIRCPNCVGTEGQPGFIKDQAGRSGRDGGPRRFWACQRSNGASQRQAGKTRCSRQNCTAFIKLAQ
jgi:hypothetical protein